MFLKRKSLVVNMVDADQTDQRLVQERPSPGEKIVVAKEITKCAALLVGIYILADTARQCCVYTATVKIK